TLSSAGCALVQWRAGTWLLQPGRHGRWLGTTSNDDATEQPNVSSEAWTNGLLSFTYTTGSWLIPCNTGLGGPARLYSNLPWPTHAQNGCSTRVWLYRYSNGTGPTLCLNPHTNTGTFQHTWRYFYISGNFPLVPVSGRRLAPQLLASQEPDPFLAPSQNC